MPDNNCPFCDESERENITEVWIDRDGIKAVFETRAACVK